MLNIFSCALFHLLIFFSEASRSFPYFNGLSVFLLLDFKSSLYSMDVVCYKICVSKMLPQFVGHLFIFLKVSLTELDDLQTEEASLKHVFYKELEIQPVHPQGDQFWVFSGRTDVEAETPILWPPDAKSWLIWKYLDAGKDWGQEEKGTTEDEMVGRHHQLNGHEFE